MSADLIAKLRERAAYLREHDTGNHRVNFTPTQVLLDRAIEALENPRDDPHTMEKLYDYRMLYNAHAFNAWHHDGAIPVFKSWRHSDGELCFGGGWFVVVAELTFGQVSNHYRAEHWDLFEVQEVETAPEYDGHTPAIAAERLRTALRMGVL